MFQIKNIKLYLIFLLFPCAVYSATDCELTFHSKSKSRFSLWLSFKSLSETVKHPEINTSRLYQLQYRDPVFNSTSKSDWLSYNKLVQFVQDAENNPAAIARTYQIRYKLDQPNLAHRTAQTGLAVARNTVNTVIQPYKKLQDDVRASVQQRTEENLDSNSFSENLKFVGKLMAANTVGLGVAGVKTAANATANTVSNAGKKIAEARANRVAARADRRAERAQAKVEAKEQKAQEKADRRTERAQAKVEAKEQKAQEKAQAEADAKAQADAKTQAEADAKTQAEADAKTQAEADAKTQAEADAKTQAEADAKKQRAQKAQSTETAPEILNQKISDYLNLGTRLNKTLPNANIITMKDLLERSEADLLKVKDIAEKSVEKIKEQLKEKGLSLRLPTAVESEWA